MNTAFKVGKEVKNKNLILGIIFSKTVEECPNCFAHRGYWSIDILADDLEPPIKEFDNCDIVRYECNSCGIRFRKMEDNI